MNYMLGYAMHWGATLKHKWWVILYAIGFSCRLSGRALIHDWSKFTHQEAKRFARVIRKLKTSTYGTPEYSALLKEIKPSIDAHYRRNPHHPEHWAGGMKGMALLDLTEMTFDWLAASKRHTDGDAVKSVAINQKRFEYGDTLAAILTNTFQRKRKKGDS